MNGSNVWAMQATRPDLAFTTSTLGRFNSRPMASHYGAAKRAVRYLQPTRELGILLGGTSEPDLIGYTDSDRANNKDNRKSVGSYVFMLYGGARFWKSKLQKSV